MRYGHLHHPNQNLNPSRNSESESDSEDDEVDVERRESERSNEDRLAAGEAGVGKDLGVSSSFMLRFVTLSNKLFSDI